MWQGFAFNCSYLGALFLAIGLFAWFAHRFERRVGRFIACRAGWRAVLLTGWIGVPLHELSHLLTAKLFRHRIISWSLFDPDPVTGTLGHVRHAYSDNTIYQRVGYVFIALAPLATGLAVLWTILLWMAPIAGRVMLAGATNLKVQHAASLEGWLAVALQLINNTVSLAALVWRYRTHLMPLQLYLGTSVAAHMAPSRSDFAAAGQGWLALLLALFCAAGAGAVWNADFARVLVLLAPLPPLFASSAFLLFLYALVVSLFTRRTRATTAAHAH